MSVFIKNGYFSFVEQNSNEIPERYFYRGYAIVNKRPMNNDEYERSVVLSNYLSNIKFLGCSYSEKIHVLCDQFSVI